MTDKRSDSDKTTNREDTKLMIIQCKIFRFSKHNLCYISHILGICIISSYEFGNWIKIRRLYKRLKKSIVIADCQPMDNFRIILFIRGDHNSIIHKPFEKKIRFSIISVTSVPINQWLTTTFSRVKLNSSSGFALITQPIARVFLFKTKFSC